MGGCTSSPVRTIKPRMSKRLRSKKIKLKKKNNEAGGEPVAVNENVVTTITSRELVSSDCTHEPTNVELHTTQSAANGTICLFLILTRI